MVVARFEEDRVLKQSPHRRFNPLNGKWILVSPHRSQRPWLGQAEAADFYGAVDVVVAPAVWAEPFGRVVVEAVGHGRGVIASRIGGLPEAAHGADRLALVEPGDVGELTQAMRRVMAAPERWRFGEGGRALWTETSIVEAHRAVYRQVLSSRSSRISADRDQA